MHKKKTIFYFFIIFLLSFNFSANAQQLSSAAKVKVDSLDEAATNLINEGLFDDAVQNIFEAALIYYRAKNMTKAAENFEKAKKLGKSTGDSRRQIKINNYLTSIYHDNGEFESALLIYRDNLKYYKSKGQRLNEAKELLKIADALSATDRASEAIKNIEKALKISQQRSDSSLILDCYLDLADNYKKRNNESKHKFYINKIQKFNFSQYNEVNVEDVEKMARLKEHNEREKKKREKMISIADSLGKAAEMKLAVTEEDNKLKDARIAQQDIVRNFIIVILLIFLLFSAVFFYQNRQRKKANTLLAAQNDEINKQKAELERLSIVASGTDNAVMIMDAEGNFEWVNESYTRLFGLSLEQLVTNKSKNIIGENTSDEIKELIETGIRNKETISYNLSTKTKAGNEITVQATITPILDENGEIKKLIAIDSDITKIVEAEAKIKRQAAEIMQKSEEMQQINQQLQHQHKHITGSITYARTIQKAIMPIKSQMDTYFDSFLIFKPKDIVSGDFAWFSQIEKTEENKAYSFAAIVDCTGHGVPGAFMSMIGSRLLNEIVNEKRIFEPSEILEKLNTGVQVALKQKFTDNNDGMDVCLCRLETLNDNEALEREEGKERDILVTFSGAKRPLFFIKEGKEIETVRGDRKSIGGVRSKRSKVNFTNKEIHMKTGDLLYLTTDGMIDQNGPDRKRFGSTRFLNILVEMQEEQLETQAEILSNALLEYQDNQEQRDDITVMGIKI